MKLQELMRLLQNFFHDTGGLNLRTPYLDGSIIWDYNNGTNSRVRISAELDNLQPRLFRFRMNEYNRRVYVDTAFIVNADKPYTFTATDTVLQFMPNMDSHVFQFMITTDAIAVDDVPKIQAYMMCKAGISLPSGHTYVNQCP